MAVEALQKSQFNNQPFINRNQKHYLYLARFINNTRGKIILITGHLLTFGVETV